MTKLLKYNSTSINYKVEGKGKVIVLLHGFLESLEIFNDFSVELSKDFKVISIDLLGHGKTGNIAEIHSMEMMADAVKFVLDSLKIKTCTMIGHSMGGSVALAYAEMYPEMLNGFSLFHSTSYDDSSEVKKNRDRMVEAVNKNHLDFIYSFIPNLFPPEDLKKYAKKIKQLQEMAGAMSKESVVAALLGMKIRRNRVDILSNPKLPVLFIIGKKDTRQPIERVLPQIAAAHNANVLILGEVAHMGYIESPKEILIAIKSFVNQVNL